MTDEEYQKLLAKMVALKKRVSTNKKAAKDFLVSAGIINEAGKLRKPDQGLRQSITDTDKPLLQVLLESDMAQYIGVLACL